MLVSTIILADFSHRDWQYFKSVSLPPETPEDGLVKLTPDREVFAGSAPALADLRIISNTDREVPYKLEIGRSERQQTKVTVSSQDKTYVPGGYTMFAAELGPDGASHNEIEIQTPSTDFGRTAVVETSTDGVTWTKVTEKTIYDFTAKEQSFTARDTRIRYPETTARYVRVKIADEGGVPLEIAGATVFLARETEVRQVSWPISTFSIGQDKDNLTTLIKVDLGTSGLPSYCISVAVPEVNFFREVSVEESTDGKRWHEILSQTNIYAYNTQRFTGQNLSATYPETTARFLRLTIHDKDNSPLDIQEVTVSGYQRWLVFPAEAAESYRLYYGNLAARRPSYDIERVFPYLMAEELPEAGLDSQELNPQFVEKKPPLTERFPWLLPTIVALAAIILAAVLIRIIYQARRVLPPPNQ